MVFGTFLLLVSRIELILFPLDFYLSHEMTQMEGKQLMEEAEAARIRVSWDCGGSYSNQIEPAGVRVGLQLGRQGASRAAVDLMPGQARVASKNYRGRLKLAML